MTKKQLILAAAVALTVAVQWLYLIGNKVPLEEIVFGP